MSFNLISKDQLSLILSSLSPRTRYQLGRLLTVNKLWNIVILNIANKFIYSGRFPLQFLPENERVNFIQENANKITFLKLSKKTNLKTFTFQLPNLTSLYLKNCSQLNDENLKVVFSLPNLFTLTVTGHQTQKVSHKAFVDFEKNEGIKTLNIRNCHWITNKILEKISKLKNLTTLDVGSSLNLFIEELIFPEKEFKNLTSLTIHSSKINDSNFLNLLKLSNLTFLDVSSDQITDLAFKNIQDSAFKQISILRLNFCNITEIGLEFIPKIFPNLSSFYVNKSNKDVQ